MHVAYPFKIIPHNQLKSLILADRGEEGLLLVNKLGNQIDLIIADVIMPKISGIDLAKKAQQLLPDIAILFISGYNEDKRMTKMRATKKISFVSKPFQTDKLLQAVIDLL